MNYYKEKMRANIKINDIVEALRKSKREVKVSKIVLEITNTCAVSEKAVSARLELIANNDDSMIIKEDIIKWL